jgi:SET domain-containing protein
MLASDAKQYNPSVSIPRKQIVRRRSAIAGWGVYAGEPITKNTRIVDYTGERISYAESVLRETVHLPKGRIWCFTLNRRVVIDGSVGGNISRFINHACKSNCYTQIIDGVIWIRASRNIGAGEELTFDYNTEGAAGIACRCRPGCPTKI